jgi:hypothetical protein
MVKPVRSDELIGALEAAGVALCRLQGSSVVLLKKTEDRDDIEEHLRRAGCEVHRATDVAGVTALTRVDVAIIDGADATETGRTAASIANALPTLPILALVDPSSRLLGPLAHTVRPMFRGDALRLDRLVRTVWTVLQPASNGEPSLPPTRRTESVR